MLKVLVPTLLGLWLAGIGVAKAFFVVREEERLVVFRLGRAVRVRGPGRVMLIPFVEQGRKFDISDDFDERLIDAYEAQFEQARQG